MYDRTPVGANPDGKIKEINVVYDACYSGTATRVDATVLGESRYSDTFSATILDIQPWGFRARIQRIDRPRSDWGQRGVNMRWRAYFSK